MFKYIKTYFKDSFFSSIKKNNGINNQLIILNENGNEIKTQYIKNLTINFNGNNNIIKLYKNIKIPEKITINCSDNNLIDIGKSEYKISFQIPHTMSKNSQLIIGNNTSIFGATFILHKEPNLKIIIGNDCMIAKEVLFQTTDSHTIYNSYGKILNKPRDIILENHVWIARRAIILKGSFIPQNSIVGIGSIYTQKSNQEKKSGVICTGIPAKIIKENINWSRKHTTDFDIQNF